MMRFHTAVFLCLSQGYTGRATAVWDPSAQYSGIVQYLSLRTVVMQDIEQDNNMILFEENGNILARSIVVIYILTPWHSARGDQECFGLVWLMVRHS